jgi:hypothetical protein
MVKVRILTSCEDWDTYLAVMLNVPGRQVSLEEFEDNLSVYGKIVSTGGLPCIKVSPTR